MQNRLSIFIKHEELTSGKLADLIGVQPSSISHILSGRNKPGFDFIAKIIQRFPLLNPKWLILGEGPMYFEDNAKNTLEHTDSDYIDSVNDFPETTIDLTNGLLFGDIQQENVKNDEIVKYEETSKQQSLKNKDIERIIIFFMDGSYKEYK